MGGGRGSGLSEGRKLRGGLQPRGLLLRSHTEAPGLLAAPRWAHLESSSRQELVSTGLSVLTMHVMADTTPAASSFFTRARTKPGLSWVAKQLISRRASA